MLRKSAISFANCSDMHNARIMKRYSMTMHDKLPQTLCLHLKKKNYVLGLHLKKKKKRF